jgi:DNA polymerase
MPDLTIDFETRSILDLKKVGIYKYVEHPSTRVLCFAAEFNGYFDTFFDVDNLSDWLFDALNDPKVVIHAHNATVERLIIQRILTPRHDWPRVATSRFRCSAARAARLALPRALDKAGAALGLNTVKDREGTLVMRRLSRPIKFTDAGPLFDDTPEKLTRLGVYCAQDVKSEMAIDANTFPMPPSEERYYQLTETINERGVRVDVPLVKQLLWRANEAVDELNEEIRDLTKGKVTALTEVERIKIWVHDETGHVLETLRKEDMDGLIGEATALDLPHHVKRVLEIRQAGAKSSVAKLVAILNRVSADGRLRGAFVFHGASTGRFTSMGVQLQNLRRDTLKDFDNDIARLSEFSLDEISRCLRQVFIPEPGHAFVDADYNAIEARGVGWLFNAKKLLGIYRRNGDPYCEMGTIIYNFPVTKENTWERFVGKQTILGCGYGMGPDKFFAQCEKYGQIVPFPVCEKAVRSYRDEFYQIKKGWYEVGDAAIEAVKYPGRVTSAANGKLSFLVSGGYLQMKLPNGRRLFYKSPRITIENSSFGEREVLTYMAVDPTTKQWRRERTWGGKLTENAVQGFCRDLLFESMEELEHGKVPVVLSVHDQIVAEVPQEDAEWAKEYVQETMEYVPDWARGFPFKAEPKIALRFGK